MFENGEKDDFLKFSITSLYLLISQEGANDDPPKWTVTR